MHELYIETISSPVGSIDLITQSDVLISVDFSDCRDRMIRLLEKRMGSFSLHPQSHEYAQCLKAYFAGHLHAVENVTLSLLGTPFQNRVWSALATVPVGTTLSYGELAKQINQPKAAQAVGRANAMNPILIFLPCHRIVGKNKQMVGYSGGLDRKAWLLNHEKHYAANLPG